jgi:hypothetical protein
VSQGEKRKGTQRKRVLSSAVSSVAVVSELSSVLELKSLQGRDSVLVVTAVRLSRRESRETQL